MTKLNALVDIDGVLGDCQGALTLELQKRFGILQGLDPYSYPDPYFNRHPDVSGRMCQVVFDDAAFWRDMPAMHGAWQMMKALQEKATINIATARFWGPDQPETAPWLKRHDFWFDTLNFVENPKVEWALDNNINFAIEDNPTNALGLAEAGIRVLLIGWGYNTAVEHHRITRCSPLAAVYHLTNRTWRAA